MDDKQVHSYTMGLHLTGLAALVGIPSIIGPLIMWLIKKDESDFIDRHGKSAVNFHLTMLIAAVISIILVFVIIGIFLLIAVGVLIVVFSIIAALKANNGEEYSYPLSIPFIK
jgi:uncharacterized protein